MKPENPTILTALQAVFHSRKFIIAVMGLFSTVISLLLIAFINENVPGLQAYTQDIETAIAGGCLLLTVMLIGSIAHEDAAEKSGKSKVELPTGTIEDLLKAAIEIASTEFLSNLGLDALKDVGLSGVLPAQNPSPALLDAMKAELVKRMPSAASDKAEMLVE